MDWLRDAPWLWWVAVALLAGTVEVATVDFVFLMVAGGALVAAASGIAGVDLPLQVVVFAASTVALLITARPPLRRWAGNSPEAVMGTAALVGREARVLAPVSERAGEIKLDGEVWSARTEAAGAPLEIGSVVRVLRIDGATAVVTTDPAPGPAPNALEEGQ
jgi:membrane protein implicated in regulation of membrane protease activity